MIVSARNMRRVGIAVGLVLIMGFGLLSYHASQLPCIGSEVEHLIKLDVAKAGQAIPKGTVLTSDMLVYEEVPECFLPPNAVLREDADEFFYRLTNIELEQGSMILASDFDRPSK